MAALAKLKQKHLAKISDAECPESQMIMEERRKELSEALAKGIVYLGQNGLLSLTDGPVKPEIMPLGRQALKTKSPNEKGSKGMVNWREQGDANTNFLKKPLIGKHRCMAPFILNLGIFRVGGTGSEKNLSAVPETL